MANRLSELESYTIRRKVLKLFGASFHVLDSMGDIVAFSSQKAFKLREDIRVFSDETMTEELLSIQARQIVDFAAAYDVLDSAGGVKIGAARRRGLRSILRDSWELLDPDDQPIAGIEEDSATLAILRRFLTGLIPQTFLVRGAGGELQATCKVHFNPFIHRMTVTLAPGCELDRRLVFAASVLLCAIEGRQQ